ncbi:MAG: alpha/beta hydrolase [Saprospiraceae bacterium]|nr:MAG: Alpha/beta hydrolase family protein [Bacteroidetes bacterium OLB9]MCO6462636.1 alpha/beta hydrolase [Saprospiraceae bacterium]MCZ2339886.1 alpha/beta hydrolase [Chitinophagales bacterium]
MKQAIKNFLHQLLLPRGRQFVMNDALHIEWSSDVISDNNRKIHIFYNSRPRASTTVILCHPYLAEAHQFFMRSGHADMYLKLGCNVVLLDFNGFGLSPYQDFNYHIDLRLVSEYCAEHFPGTRLIAHGISFGGSHTVNAASLHHHKLERLIVENTLDSNLSYYKSRSKKLYYFMRFLMLFSSRINANHDYIKGCSNIRDIEKVLFIYNEADMLTTIEMGKKLYAGCAVPAQLVIMQGKHLEAIEKNPELYQDTIKEFIL